MTFFNIYAPLVATFMGAILAVKQGIIQSRDLILEFIFRGVVILN